MSLMGRDVAMLYFHLFPGTTVITDGCELYQRILTP